MICPVGTGGQEGGQYGGNSGTSLLHSMDLLYANEGAGS